MSPRVLRPIRSEIVGQSPPYIRVAKHEVAGETATREIVTLECPDWVSVVPRTSNGLVVLVRQHRYGIDGPTIEIPGGCIESGESAEQAAVRELREETGYQADALIPLGTCHPNPAFQNNRHHMFLAPDVVWAEPPHPDEGEDCEVLLWTEAQVSEGVRRGAISHALVLLALTRASESVALRSNCARLGVGADASLGLDAVLEMVNQMASLQRGKVIDLAQRLRPGLTPDDLQNPHDFPELADPDWHFYDGQLVALESVVVALRARMVGGAAKRDAPCPRAKPDPTVKG